MRQFRVTLIGLFYDMPVFSVELPAKDKLHAVRIAAAIYDNCFKRGEAVCLESM